MLPILYQNIEFLLELIGYEPEDTTKKISENERKLKKYKPI